jgi:16S rRNA processing protein RimM
LTGVPYSDFPDQHPEVIVNQIPLIVEGTWRQKDRIVFKFRGIDSIEEAEKFVGADVCIRPEQRTPLPEGEYYQSDLIGCEVIDRATDKSVGKVEVWHEYGAAPLLEVRDANGKEILIPFAKAICVKVDVGAKRIEADLPEGLLDE